MSMTRDHNTIHVPLGTRCHRVTRISNGWRVWLNTRDYLYGTYLVLYDDGGAIRVTTRPDEGDEVIYVRPCDQDIYMEQHNDRSAA